MSDGRQSRGSGRRAEQSRGRPEARGARSDLQIKQRFKGRNKLA